MTLKSLGERIKTRRQELGFTQDVLAVKANISKGFLSDLENGKRNVSAEKLLDLADVLGLSLDYLMKGEETSPTPVDINIPAQLSELAERESLSFKQTLMLLQMQRQIIAHRTTAQSNQSEQFDWVKLFQSVRSFIT